jgi:cytochrome c5
VSSRLLLRVIFVVLFVSVVVAAAPQNPSSDAKSKTTPASEKTPVRTANDEGAQGEKRFETHCGRCHVPPETLSPREAKAVLRQMRVKAGLSAEDERLILKYLAP